MPREGWPDWDIYVQRGCICEYCGFDGTTSWQTWNQLAIDHIIPRCKGGARDAVMNKAVACCYCNGHKLWYDPRSPEQAAAGLAEPLDEVSRSELIKNAFKHIQQNGLDKWTVVSAFDEMMDEIRKRKSITEENTMDLKPIINTPENEDYRFGERFAVHKKGDRIGSLIYRTTGNVLQIKPDKASVRLTKVQDEVVVELTADELKELAVYLREKVKEK